MHASAYIRLRDVRNSHRASKRVEKFLLRKLKTRSKHICRRQGKRRGLQTSGSHGQRGAVQGA